MTNNDLEYMNAINLFKSLSKKPVSQLSSFDEEFLKNYSKINTNYIKDVQGTVETYRTYNNKFREVVNRELSKLINFQ